MRESKETPVHLRPLGLLSDFIIEELPAKLHGEKKDERRWGAEVEGLLAQCPEITHLSSEEKTLALLDFVVLEAALEKDGQEPHQGLLERTQRLADSLGRAPMLTYESYILDNPLDDDPRLFSGEATAGQELLFCKTHLRIEIALKQVFDALMRFPETDGLGLAISALETATQEMLAFYKNFDPESFRVFRPFITENRVRKLPGPSGAFSAAMPAIDILLLESVERPTEQEISSPLLFPQGTESKPARAVLWSDIEKALIKRKETGPIALQSEGREAKLDLVKLLRLLELFRKRHYQLAEKNIPDVIAGRSMGTAGASPEFIHKQGETPTADYLRRMQAHVRESIKKLTT